MQSVTFEKHVGWLPGMSVVKLHAEYTLGSGLGAWSMLKCDINRFTKDVKEQCLREIANDTINRMTMVNPERHPQRGGTFGQHGSLKVDIVAVDCEDDVMHIDELEKAMYSAFWTQVADDQAGGCLTSCSATDSSACGLIAS
jgi:hypothetical protein